MASQNVDGIAADPHAWAGDKAVIDGVAHSGVGCARALGSHVALGGEAGHQIIARGKSRDDGALRDGFLDGLQILGAGMQEKMHMRIDQARQQRGVAEIDDLRAGGMCHRGTDGADAVALNQNLAGCGDVAGLDVEQARGVENDGGLAAERTSEARGNQTRDETVH